MQNSGNYTVVLFHLEQVSDEFIVQVMPAEVSEFRDRAESEFQELAQEHFSGLIYQYYRMLSSLVNICTHTDIKVRQHLNLKNIQDADVG